MPEQAADIAAHRFDFGPAGLRKRRIKMHSSFCRIQYVSNFKITGNG